MPKQKNRRLERDDEAEDALASSKKPPRWRGWALGAVAAATVTIGATVGLPLYAEHTERAAKCANSKTATAAFLSREDLEEADALLKDARRFCGSDEAEVTALEAKIATKKSAAAAKVAARAEARERDAVTDFPEDAATVRRSLKEAADKAAHNDAKSAAMLVTSSRTTLDTYKGTSVEQSEAWRELDAQERELRTKVQPYLDAQRALVEQVQTQLAEQAAQDRRDGVKLTREGWIAAASPEKLEQASKYKSAHDEEGIALLLQHDPDVIKLKDGVRVVVIEQVGVLNRYVRVRVKGTLTELWTYPEALRDP